MLINSLKTNFECALKFAWLVGFASYDLYYSLFGVFSNLEVPSTYIQYVDTETF